MEKTWILSKDGSRKINVAHVVMFSDYFYTVGNDPRWFGRVDADLVTGKSEHLFCVRGETNCEVEEAVAAWKAVNLI